MNAVARNLRQLRRDFLPRADPDKEVTQEFIAGRAGVKQSQYAKWERGGATPSARNLVRLALAFDTRIDVLVHGLDARYDSLDSDLIRHAARGTTAPAAQSKKTGADAPHTHTEARLFKLEADNRALTAEVARLTADNARLAAENAAFSEFVAAFERYRASTQSGGANQSPPPPAPRRRRRH